MQNIAFCPLCGGPTASTIPPGDNRERPVCTVCNEPHYTNPSTVVGAVAVMDEKFLLCRRSIEPRSGYWTIPAGYLELEEDAMDGAIREADEEAHAQLEIRSLLAMYSIPHISQVQLIFLADLLSEDIAPGEESLEVALFRWEEIPWSDLAFPTVKWALDHAKESLANPNLGPELRSTKGLSRKSKP